MDKTTVHLERDVETIGIILDSPEIEAMIADLAVTRCTRRPGYPIRMMVGVALVKSFHVLPT